MKRAILLAMVMLIAVTGVAMEPTNFGYVIPVVVRSPGEAGSFWTTELCFTSTQIWQGATEVEVIVALFQASGEGEGVTRVILSPYETYCTCLLYTSPSPRDRS